VNRNRYQCSTDLGGVSPVAGTLTVTISGSPPGWLDITTAPRDGTVVEIQNNWGVAPWYAVCKWVPGYGWMNATDPTRGMSDGPHLSWRPYTNNRSSYVDPTHGAQNTVGYWRRACGLND
jgi:hypothetical protein